MYKKKQKERENQSIQQDDENKIRGKFYEK